MTKRHGGFRSKTRTKLAKHYKEKGKISITRYFQEFKEGDQVILKAEPAYQKGMYYPRFHGKTGKIFGKQGNSYIVNITDGKKNKSLIIKPEHLRRVY